jgi:preprotein translocase subunit SecG
MTTFLVVMHILVCFFLIGVVLLQPGSRGGMGGAFGGGGSATVFGGRGANTLLAKLTAAAAVMFMLTSISLSFFASKSTSVFADEPSAPKVPTTPVDAAAAPSAPAPVDVVPAAPAPTP